MFWATAAISAKHQIYSRSPTCMSQSTKIERLMSSFPLAHFEAISKSDCSKRVITLIYSTFLKPNMNFPYIVLLTCIFIFRIVTHNYWCTQSHFHSNHINNDARCYNLVSNPDSGADVITSFCTSLNFGCLASPISSNNTLSLVVMKAPAAFIRWKKIFHTSTYLHYHVLLTSRANILSTWFREEQASATTWTS